MLNLLDGILAHNKQFVENKEYEKFQTSKFPNKRLVVVSCMDTRLVELLPKAMDVANGDVKIVKTAGAIVSHPFGSIMRSILVAVYELGADEVCVVGHYDCGMASLKAENTLKKMKDRGVSQESLEMLNYAGVDFEKFLHGFDCVEDSVKHSVSLIRNHPLLPKDIPVHGLVIDPKSGKLDVMVNGYQAKLSSTV
jgi:carbonic anhydrase